MSIAAASFSKTYRDEYMNPFMRIPYVQLEKNKGYPPRASRSYKKIWVTKYHQMSFRLLPEQYCFDL
jgi:ribonuclease HII